MQFTTRNYKITLRGGYDCAYTDQNTYTTVKGMVIGTGTITLEFIIID